MTAKLESRIRRLRRWWHRHGDSVVREGILLVVGTLTLIGWLVIFYIFMAAGNY